MICVAMAILGTVVRMTKITVVRVTMVNHDQGDLAC